MKNITTNQKKFGLLNTVAILSISLAGATSVSAWGPERATFTMDNPATYPTFNSITDNPHIGDERDFVRIGEITPESIDLKNEIEIFPGRQYMVYIYYHNDASATFNDKAHDFSGIALGTRMSTSFPTVLTAGEKGTITGTISARNSNPGSVWDEAYITTNANKIFLHYVSGSAQIYNDWGTNEWVMPSNLFTQEGALLGLNELNGVVLGCEEYHGTVSYVVQAEELGGSITKTVSKDDANFNESANLAPGEEVTFRLAIANTGDVALTNAVVKDTLPDGLTLVPGSVQMRDNDPSAATFEQLSNNLTGTGYNLGTIGTGNIVYITYKAVAGDNFDCVGTKLQNNASLTYDSDTPSGDTKTDSTSVTVKKTDCEEPEIPLDNCENNPSLPGCQEKTCATNPEMEGCQSLPNTGPLEIVLAIIIIAGITGGGYYLYRTKKTLAKVESKAKGEEIAKTEESPKEAKDAAQTKDAEPKEVAKEPKTKSDK